MFEPIYRILDYIFPVYIINRNEVLTIEDRRPTRNMVLSILGVLAVAVLVVWGWLSHTLLLDTLSFIVAFREFYVFDKPTDTYSFVRQSVFKKDEIKGAASLFRATEVLCEEEYSRYGTVHRYHAAVLQDPSLLFGADEVQKLRQSRPMYNREQTEANMVAAIASFLNIKNNGTVKTLYRALS
jgi:hypothetical protein